MGSHEKSFFCFPPPPLAAGLRLPPDAACLPAAAACLPLPAAGPPPALPALWAAYASAIFPIFSLDTTCGACRWRVWARVVRVSPRRGRWRGEEGAG